MIEIFEYLQHFQRQVEIFKKHVNIGISSFHNTGFAECLQWKEDAMKEIRGNADIQFSTQGTNFNIWGMPFFTEKKRQIFDAAIKKSLEIL